MQQRLPVVLSATALAVALLGSTPLGEAARDLASSVPPFAKKAGYANQAGFAKNAGAVAGIVMSRTRMRPPGPEPVKLDRSTPDSRA